MQTDSVELSFLSIFAFITFFIFLIISKYSYKIRKEVQRVLHNSKSHMFFTE